MSCFLSFSRFLKSCVVSTFEKLSFFKFYWQSLREKFNHKPVWLEILRLSQVFFVDLPTHLFPLGSRGGVSKSYSFFQSCKVRPDFESLPFLCSTAVPWNAQVCVPFPNLAELNKLTVLLITVCKSSHLWIWGARHLCRGGGACETLQTLVD